MNPPWFYAILACPDCQHELIVNSAGASCPACGFSNQPLADLRPQNPHPLTLSLARKSDLDPAQQLQVIETSPPSPGYHGPRAQHRDSTQFMSIIADYFKRPTRVLDLGCGPRDQEIPIRALGHEYVGVDICSTTADFLADAHALPFKTASVDCILTYAVLLALRNPVVALSEIERVLKPGGLYLGTISQGEPFLVSYFHMTAWGLLSLIDATPSLRVTRLWAANDTLSSLSRWGGYSKVIKQALGVLNWVNTTFPFLTPRKMLWPKKAREIDALHRAGSIAFVVQKISELRN